MSIIPGTLLRVQVERLPGRIDREAKALWLWWDAPDATVLDLDVAWRAYARRSDLEHTHRFVEQSLGWTTPKIRTPEQADRWTWLVIAAYTQLRLARTLVGEHRLPWQPPLPPNGRTPARVRRGYGHLLARLPRVARAPKPAGRPPGHPKSRRSTPPPRHPGIRHPDIRHPPPRHPPSAIRHPASGIRPSRRPHNGHPADGTHSTRQRGHRPPADGPAEACPRQ
jgi:hypothetical protein